MALRAQGLGLTTKIYGVPVKLGTIVATTTKNNHDTATPFNNTGTGLGGKTLLIQSDAACYVKFGTANTVTATSTAATADIKLAADQLFYVNLPESYGWLAAVSASGTANVRVWELI